jgi:hypothetical protein
MDKLMMKEIAEQAYIEENLPWQVYSIAPNPNNSDEWELYYDAWGERYHRILVRVTPQADSTPESVKTEVRNFLRELKEGGWL